VSADWLRAGIESSGGSAQAKIVMSRQRRGLRGWTDGMVHAIPPQSIVTACVLLSALLHFTDFVLFYYFLSPDSVGK